MVVKGGGSEVLPLQKVCVGGGGAEKVVAMSKKCLWTSVES